MSEHSTTELVLLTILYLQINYNNKNKIIFLSFNVTKWK